MNFIYYLRNLGFFCWIIISYFGIISPLLKYIIPDFIGMYVIPIVMFVFGLTTFLGRKKHLETFDYAILLVVSEFFLQAITSYFSYGQPIVKGLLASRIFLVLLFVYYLASKPTSMVYLFKLNISLSRYVMPLSLFALLVLNIDNGTIANFFHVSSDSIVDSSEVKGSILSYAASGVPVFFVYYLIEYVQRRNKIGLYMILLVLIYALFCAKGRLQLVGYVGVLVICCLQNKNPHGRKLLLYTLVVFFAVTLYDPHQLDSLSALGDFFGLSGNVEDQSVLIRVTNREIMMPVILAHPIFGVGNLSNQFHPNFFDIFHEQFYISDMGYMGIILTGGIVKCIIYIFFFVSALRKCNQIGRQVDIIKYLIFFHLYITIAGGDTFMYHYDIPLLIAPLLNIKCLEDKKYPLFGG